MKNLNLKTKQGWLDDFFLTSETLNTEAGKEYADIASIAATLCHAPLAVVYLVDEFKQSFTNKKIMSSEDHAAVLSLCRHANKQTPSFFEVTDTLKDELLVNHPLVNGNMQLRYFVSVAIKSMEGKRIGVIGVMGIQPNALSKEQRNALETIAMMAGKMLEASFHIQMAKEYQENLRRERDIEKNMLRIVRNHVLKPIESLKATVELCGYEGLDTEKLAVRELLSNRLSGTIDTIENIIDWGNVLIDNKYQKQIKEIDIHELVKEILGNYLIQATLKNNRLMNLTEENLTVKTDENILRFILKNLLNNANTVTENGTITIYAEEDVEHVMISVCDTGEGMTPEQLKNLYTKEMSSANDDIEESDVVLSFRLVKDFVEELDASMQIKSMPDEGTAIFLYFSK